MTVTCIGMGLGDGHTLTAEGLSALREADCVIGAQRLLDALPEGVTSTRLPMVLPAEIADFIRANDTFINVCVAYSGDTGFYSGASHLRRLVGETVSLRILPGISSVQALAARLGRAWQGMHLVSAHAADSDPVPHVLNHAATLFLTGAADVATLCRRLLDADMGFVRVTAAENLGAETQCIREGSPADFVGERFASLTLMLVDNPRPLWPDRVTQGLPDAAFLRGDVPMTKQAVRAVALAKLGVGREDVLYDIGAGTGSVAVEMALLAREGSVFAVEMNPDGCELIRANRERFGVYNLRLIEGEAPAALRDLPTPDAVFIGGTKGKLAPILDTLVEQNPALRVAVTAIALESVGEALALLGGERFTDLDITQLSVAGAREVGGLHMMMGANPITIISAKGIGCNVADAKE